MVEIRRDVPEFWSVAEKLNGDVTPFAVQRLLETEHADWELVRACMVLIGRIPSGADPKDATARDLAEARVQEATGDPLTRDQYETECRRLGLQIHPDHMCVQILLFVGWPHYTADFVATCVLAKRRAREIHAFRKTLLPCEERLG
jgi:hypothetical protein